MFSIVIGLEFFFLFLVELMPSLMAMTIVISRKEIGRACNLSKRPSSKNYMLWTGQLAIENYTLKRENVTAFFPFPTMFSFVSKTIQLSHP